jgi:hypothetical protein
MLILSQRDEIIYIFVNLTDIKGMKLHTDAVFGVIYEVKKECLCVNHVRPSVTYYQQPNRFFFGFS